MELENMAANTADTGTVETGADTSAVGGAAAPSGESSERDITTTQSFSRRLNEMTARNTDAAIKALGMTNPYTNSPIETLSQMQEYRAMQRADEDGSDVQTAAELSRLRSQIAGYQMREEEAAIKADPNLAAVYEDYHDDVTALMEYAAAEGNALDLRSALQVVMSQNYDAIRAKDMERARAEAMAGMKANAAASPGSVGGAPAGGSVNYADMSKTDFQRLVESVKRGEHRKS